jgi:putative PIN family toxin of toxin-antitoxin system
MRVVIDTNIWLSGLMLPAGVPGQIVRAALTGEFIAVMSEALRGEVGVALHYPKVRRRILLADEDLQRFLAELRYTTELVDIAGAKARVPRDRGDDIVLATFVASHADYLLSGDADLLALRPKVPVLTAREFYDQHLR